MGEFRNVPYQRTFVQNGANACPRYNSSTKTMLTNFNAKLDS
jgi:hypothetical protein